ncbi:MAG: hypothetical protein N2Z74_00865 [Syntrophales bacterium]|nr:hypothetical protein [Syntrophales bacterium]
MRPQDIILLVVVFTSMAAGICCPEVFTFLQPYPLIFLMILFFMSFLSISLGEVGHALRASPVALATFIVLKMMVLPPLFYAAFLLFMPLYAPSALLLTAVSTGVVAPFISHLVGGNSARVLVAVVLTSVLVPLTLPAVIEAVLSTQVELSFGEMLRVLSLAVFVPIVAVQTLRRLAPQVLLTVKGYSFPVNVVMFALIILAIFSRYADIFYRQPRLISEALVAAVVLAILYSFVGMFLFRGAATAERLAGAVMFTHMNNVLIIVFAARFFGPREVMTAAMYIIPFFALIVPLRKYGERRRDRGTMHDGGPLDKKV